MYQTKWAQAVLKMSNLRIVVLDTTGVGHDADLLRVYTCDASGDEAYDTLVAPGRHLGTANTAHTGIGRAEIDFAPQLHEVWPAIQGALQGHYIIAYGLDFVQERLNENANHHKLEQFELIGDDLLFVVSQYLRRSAIKLPDACAQLGHKMPARPIAAPDRAHGQIMLLRAMAAGRLPVDDSF